MYRRKRELFAFLFLSFGWFANYCYCSVALPYGDVSWSSVSDCGIALSYSLPF